MVGRNLDEDEVRSPVFLVPLVSEIILHSTPFPITHIDTLRITVHGFTAISIAIIHFLVMFPLRCSHFCGMFFTPLCSTILKPNLEETKIGKKGLISS